MKLLAPYFNLFLLKKTAFVAVVCFACSCTALKLVPENQYLYTEAKLKLEANGKIPDKNNLQSKLEGSIRPKPNAVFLGMRPSLWFYYKAGTPKKKKGLRNFIKNKLGKKPVYLTDATPDRTALNLKSILINDGFFEAQV
ncbi:MAG: hypothetical protein H7Y04_12420, partial [Verrucomicrobia bacterium]|nr:hypothetical protein [Cytophagales bacterium]